jgi:predicted oxidoreductase
VTARLEDVGTTERHRSDQQLVYGCMGLGGSWDPSPYGAAEVTQASLAVHAALETGITVFDHADIYRSGKSESVFGELLAEDPRLRARVHLQTKCGIRLGDDGLAVHYDLSAPHVRRQVETSLERLQTDHLDTLLLHRPDPLTDPAETAEALVALHEDGLVQRFGVSNMSGEQMAALERHLPATLAVNQLELSLAKRDWLETAVGVNGAQDISSTFVPGTLEHCAQTGATVQAWSPLARGVYSGAGSSGADPAELATGALVRRLADDLGVAPESVVLGWLMKHPASVDPVIGTTSPERIRACSDAASVSARLTRTDWYDLWVSARGLDLP